MRKTREEKAITLIALIITIVVLLILAVVAINAVTGDGIIQHASNAKTEYEKAQDEENSILSYYEGYLNNKGNMGPWQQVGDSVTNINTNEKIELGAIVNYDPTIDENNNAISKEKLTKTSYGTRTGAKDDSNNLIDQTFSVVNNNNEKNYNGTWQVIGVENGRILLVSTEVVAESYSLNGKLGYQYGIEELNSICSIYGYGKGANTARSIKLEDIDRLAGYDPEKERYKDESKSPYEYGEIITYAIGEDGKIEYKSETETEYNTSNNTIFKYLEDGQWKDLEENKPKKIKQTFYKTDLSNLSSELLEMLKTNSGFYMATTYESTERTGGMSLGLRAMQNTTGYTCLYTTDNIEYQKNHGIRPVVELDSNVKLTKSGNTWNIN